MGNKRYNITGSFEGRTINKIVLASSKKQAKLRGAFEFGLRGHDVRAFMKSRSIRVVKY